MTGLYMTAPRKIVEMISENFMNFWKQQVFLFLSSCVFHSSHLQRPCISSDVSMRGSWELLLFIHTDSCWLGRDTEGKTWPKRRLVLIWTFSGLENANVQSDLMFRHSLFSSCIWCQLSIVDGWNVKKVMVETMWLAMDSSRGHEGTNHVQN